MNAELATSRPNELRVYRSYPFELSKAIHDRIAASESVMKDVLKESGVTLDWVAYQRLSDDATAKAAKLEMVSAFRVRCQAFRMLSKAFNAERNKDESFKPNYTQPAQALSGSS
jgi:LPS sulfotransferase NodH